MRLDRLALTSSIFAAGLIAGTAQAEELHIGYAAAATGYLAHSEQPILAGVQYAAEQINAAGGDLTIRISVKDTRSDTAQTLIAVQELISEGIDILISPCDVDPSVAAGNLTNAAQIPTFSSCASTPTLPAIVGDFMYVNYPPDNIQAAALAQYAWDEGYRTPYILVSRDTPYTEKLPEYFAESFVRLGGSPAVVGEYTLGQQDFLVEISKIGDLDPAPDVIMTSAYEPDFPAFLRQLRSAGIDTPVLGSDGIDSPTTVSLGEISQGVVYSNAGFAAEGSALTAFNAQYETDTGHAVETTSVAVGHDLVQVIAAAASASTSMDGPDLKSAIDNLVDVQGATGPITFKDQNRIPLRAVALNRVVGDGLELAAAIQPDAALVAAP